ncbi:hypothetical protein CANCADRAFT_106048 [Tortispora caseinolytica NRRL Y-17796]|uniref:Transcription regulator Rua1 C-terminal domain-containing protein n=1 Tax=Tortispora caseinolytica NRRL Y-17796 TaxID=767744 RepID=A0A1E4TFC8_9ASCO|nr:hypothetical protein CANCADRAFT_106048 [Tortispora caseinolytica NRRL Y-17796]
MGPDSCDDFGNFIDLQSDTNWDKYFHVDDLARILLDHTVPDAIGAKTAEYAKGGAEKEIEPEDMRPLKLDDNDDVGTLQGMASSTSLDSSSSTVSATSIASVTQAPSMSNGITEDVTPGHQPSLSPGLVDTMATDHSSQEFPTQLQNNQMGHYSLVHRVPLAARTMNTLAMCQTPNTRPMMGPPRRPGRDAAKVNKSVLHRVTQTINTNPNVRESGAGQGAEDVSLDVQLPDNQKMAELMQDYPSNYWEMDDPEHTQTGLYRNNEVQSSGEVHSVSQQHQPRQTSPNVATARNLQVRAHQSHPNTNVFRLHKLSNENYSEALMASEVFPATPETVGVPYGFAIDGQHIAGGERAMVTGLGIGDTGSIGSEQQFEEQQLQQLHTRRPRSYPSRNSGIVLAQEPRVDPMMASFALTESTVRQDGDWKLHAEPASYDSYEQLLREDDLFMMEHQSHLPRRSQSQREAQSQQTQQSQPQAQLQPLQVPQHSHSNSHDAAHLHSQQSQGEDFMNADEDKYILDMAERTRRLRVRISPQPYPEDFEVEDQSMIPIPQDLRGPDDKYGPLWVRGKGDRKEGWCDMCGKWLCVKNSAYWYDRNFHHGVSPFTRRYHYDPIRTKTVSSTDDSLLGYCGYCNSWCAISKRGDDKCTSWFRHADKCYRSHEQELSNEEVCNR